MTPYFSLIIVSVCLWAYSPAWSADWVMEDSAWWSNNPTLAPRGLTVWTWQFTKTPESAHLLGLTLHGTVALLTGLLSHRLGLSLLASLAAGLFLFVHPITVETAAYAASRSELIAAVGVMGACLLAVSLHQWWKWPLIGACILLGVLRKESAVIALGLVPLVLWYTGRPWRLVASVNVFVAGTIVGYYYEGIDHIMNRADYAREIGMGDWMLMQASATVHMLTVIVTGSGMTPDVDYDAMTLHQHGMNLQLLGFGLLAASMFVYRFPVVLVGLLWLVIALAPRFVVQTPTGYLSEHPFYGALPGLGMVAGWAFTCAVDRA